MIKSLLLSQISKIHFGLFITLEYRVQWTLEIVSLEIVDSLVLVDKSALTNILFSKFS